MQSNKNKFTFSTLLASYCDAILCFYIEYANILLDQIIQTLCAILVTRVLALIPSYECTQIKPICSSLNCNTKYSLIVSLLLKVKTIPSLPPFLNRHQALISFKMILDFNTLND